MIEKLRYSDRGHSLEKINEIIDWINFQELERAGDKAMNYFNKSPESTSSNEDTLTSASKDTNTQNIQSVPPTSITSTRDTQNLKGCGKICANCGKEKSRHYEVPVLDGEKPIFECDIVKDSGKNYRFKKCQGKVKDA